ncbi:hypothetical protein C8R44DRAFT_733831 [Mycena epipterygia]|nr:hypothetical protein C8R44DRAFT_733831 [Mycena epipterygia]
MSTSRCPAAMQYIDDSAQDADHDERPAFDDDDGDDDEDSAEAEVRRHDNQAFDMPYLLGMHELRLRAPTPYRIPMHQLQAGAATPSRGEDMDMADLPPSRPVSPAFGFGVPPAQQMSRASTPAYTPASVFFPNSWGATPDTRVGTPLFMPGSWGPTPYQYEYRTPTPFSGGLLPERRAGPSSPPPAKRRRLESSPPPRRPLKNVEQYFDTAAEDSNEGDAEEERNEEDEETLSDIEPPMRLVADDDAEDLHALAASYERDAPAYQRELRCSAFIFAVPDNAPARAGPSTEALPVNTLLKSYDHDLRRVGETSKASNLGTLLRRGPVIEQMPVGGWVRFRVGSNKGRVALVLSSTKTLIACGINNSCQPIELSRAVDSTQADRVTTPSVEEMAPFQTSQHPALRVAPFLGPCAALQEGDRVAVVGGDHRGQTGYIVMLRDVPVVNESGHRRSARYAKIQNEYDGTTPIQKRGPGFFVELGHLKRHLQPLDRVHVVSGLVHRGLSGRAIKINDDQVKVKIPSPPTTPPASTKDASPTPTVSISVCDISADTSNVGISLKSCEDFTKLGSGKDTTHDEIKISRAEHIETKTLQSSFRVRSADVQFVIFGDSNTPFASSYSAEYTQRTEIAHPRAPAARRYENTLTEMGPAPDDEAGANDYHVLRNFLLRKVNAYRAEPSVEDILRHDQAHQERISQLMKTKQHFVGFPVQAAFKTHINKGRLGVVKDEHESPERRKRLAALTRRRRTPGLSDIKGILCTVQWDGSNQKDDIPIENLVHRFTNLTLDRALFLPAAILTGAQPSKPLPRLRTPSPETPPPGEELWGATPPLPKPTLAGEDTGEWLCNKGLINKRLDIVFKGIATFDNRLMKNSPKWGPLEGKTGVLVLANTAPNRRVNKDSLTKKKVKVFRPGSNTANPLEVPPPTIKPRRTVGDGTSIALITQRVVIAGPSHFGELPENIGRYAETRPNPADARMYGVNYVSVQVEGGDKYMYHTSSLCLALNEAIMESSPSHCQVVDFSSNFLVASAIPPKQYNAFWRPKLSYKKYHDVATMAEPTTRITQRRAALQNETLQVLPPPAPRNRKPDKRRIKPPPRETTPQHDAAPPPRETTPMERQPAAHARQAAKSRTSPSQTPSPPRAFLVPRTPRASPTVEAPPAVEPLPAPPDIELEVPAAPSASTVHAPPDVEEALPSASAPRALPMPPTPTSPPPLEQEPPAGSAPPLPRDRVHYLAHQLQETLTPVAPEVRQSLGMPGLRDSLGMPPLPPSVAAGPIPAERIPLVASAPGLPQMNFLAPGGPRIATPAREQAPRTAADFRAHLAARKLFKEMPDDEMDVDAVDGGAPSNFQDMDVEGYLDITTSPPHRQASPPPFDNISSGNATEDDYSDSARKETQELLHKRGSASAYKDLRMQVEDDAEEEEEFEQEVAAEEAKNAGKGKAKAVGRRKQSQQATVVSDGRAQKKKSASQKPADARAENKKAATHKKAVSSASSDSDDSNDTATSDSDASSARKKKKQRQKSAQKNSSKTATAHDDDAASPGHYKGGPVDQKSLDLLHQWKEEYESKVEELASTLNKPSSTLWEIIEGGPRSVRVLSSWNMFERWLYAESGGNQKHGPEVSKAERGKLDRAKYMEALAPAKLSTAELKQRDVVLAALPWLVEWHANLEDAVRTQRASNGGLQRGIKQVAREMAKYSALAWKELNIHLIGWVISTGGGSKSFGATPAFKLMKQRHSSETLQTLREYELKLHVLEMEIDGATAKALLQSKKQLSMEYPSLTDYSNATSKRDGERKFVKDGLVADIREWSPGMLTTVLMGISEAILVDRGEMTAQQAASGLFAMKWASWDDYAFENQMRIENWNDNMAAQGHHPKRGFQVTSFADKDLAQIIPAMELRHGLPRNGDDSGNESDDEELRDQALRVVEWTADLSDEMASSLTEQVGIPTITSRSGVELSTVGHSVKYQNACKKMQAQQEKEKAKTKAKAKSKAPKGAPTTTTTTMARKRPRADSSSPPRRTRYSASPISPRSRSPKPRRASRSRSPVSPPCRRSRSRSRTMPTEPRGRARSISRSREERCSRSKTRGNAQSAKKRRRVSGTGRAEERGTTSSTRHDDRPDHRAHAASTSRHRDNHDARAPVASTSRQAGHRLDKKKVQMFDDHEQVVVERGQQYLNDDTIARQASLVKFRLKRGRGQSKEYLPIIYGKLEHTTEAHNLADKSTWYVDKTTNEWCSVAARAGYVPVFEDDQLDIYTNTFLLLYFEVNTKYLKRLALLGRRSKAEPQSRINGWHAEYPDLAFGAAGGQWKDIVVPTSMLPPIPMRPFKHTVEDCQIPLIDINANSDVLNYEPVLFTQRQLNAHAVNQSRAHPVNHAPSLSPFGATASTRRSPTMPRRRPRRSGHCLRLIISASRVAVLPFQPHLHWRTAGRSAVHLPGWFDRREGHGHWLQTSHRHALYMPAFTVLKPWETTVIRRMDEGDTWNEIRDRIRVVEARVRKALEAGFAVADYDVLEAQLGALHDLEHEFHNTQFADFHLPPPAQTQYVFTLYRVVFADIWSRAPPCQGRGLSLHEQQRWESG